MLLNPKVVERTKEQSAAFVPKNLQRLDDTVKHSPAFDSLGDSDYELEFTSNSVVLEIEGAEADLTIVDLPGIIQSHPKVRASGLGFDLVLWFFESINSSLRTNEGGESRK